MAGTYILSFLFSVGKSKLVCDLYDQSFAIICKLQGVGCVVSWGSSYTSWLYVTNVQGKGLVKCELGIKVKGICVRGSRTRVDFFNEIKSFKRRRKTKVCPKDFSYTLASSTLSHPNQAPHVLHNGFVSFTFCGPFVCLSVVESLATYTFKHFIQGPKHNFTPTLLTIE